MDEFPINPSKKESVGTARKCRENFKEALKQLKNQANAKNTTERRLLRLFIEAVDWTSDYRNCQTFGWIWFTNHRSSLINHPPLNRSQICTLYVDFKQHVLLKESVAELTEELLTTIPITLKIIEHDTDCVDQKQINQLVDNLKQRNPKYMENNVKEVQEIVDEQFAFLKHQNIDKTYIQVVVNQLLWLHELIN